MRNINDNYWYMENTPRGEAPVNGQLVVFTHYTDIFYGILRDGMFYAIKDVYPSDGNTFYIIPRERVLTDGTPEQAVMQRIMHNTFYGKAQDEFDAESSKTTLNGYMHAYLVNGNAAISNTSVMVYLGMCKSMNLDTMDAVRGHHYLSFHLPVDEQFFAHGAPHVSSADLHQLVHRHLTVAECHAEIITERTPRTRMAIDLGQVDAKIELVHMAQLQFMICP